MEMIPCSFPKRRRPNTHGQGAGDQMLRKTQRDRRLAWHNPCKSILVQAGLASANFQREPVILVQ